MPSLLIHRTVAINNQLPLSAHPPGASSLCLGTNPCAVVIDNTSHWTDVARPNAVYELEDTGTAVEEHEHV